MQRNPLVCAAWSSLGLPWGAEGGTPGPPLLSSPSVHVSFPLPWTPTLPSLAGSISPLSHVHLGGGAFSHAHLGVGSGAPLDQAPPHPQPWPCPRGLQTAGLG